MSCHGNIIFVAIVVFPVELLAYCTKFHCSGRSRGGAQGAQPPPPPLFWVKNKEMTERRRASGARKTEPGPLLSWIRHCNGLHCELAKIALFKDVCAKIFQSMELFKFLLQADNELLVPEMQKKIGGHCLRFRDKACGKLRTDFEKYNCTM